jgi:glucose/arabinose dehydrogenase
LYFNAEGAIGAFFYSHMQAGHLFCCIHSYPQTLFRKFPSEPGRSTHLKNQIMAKFYARHRKLFIISFISFLLAVIGNNGMAQPTVIFRQFMGGFSSPVDVVNAGDGSNRLFIVQRTGLIRILRDSAIVATPFINLTDSIISTGGEQGLLSLAFHPDYETNRTFFVYYTNTDGEITVVRFQTSIANPDVADASTGKILLNIPKSFTNHNGGDLNFGSDGYLYFGTGDGGSGGDPGNNAQNGNSLLGKLLRLNINNIEVPPYYTIPPDNPYVGDPNVRDEIYSMGLRNPWRWSFDRVTNDLWLADVGQNEWEELNFRESGTTNVVNYGWRCYEGTHEFNTNGCLPASNYNMPIFEYPHDTTGGFSVTGGFVYRGPDFPNLTGYYLMSDFVTGHLWKVIRSGAGFTVTRQPLARTNISSYGEAENGALFAVTLGGTLFKVEATVDAPLPVTLLNFVGTSGTGGVNLTWETTFEQNIRHFDVEYSDDNIDFTSVGIVAARNAINGETYRFNHTVFNKQRVYYRLKMVDLDGSTEYSKTITLEITGSARNYVFPTLATNGTIGLYLTESFENVEIVDLQGKILKKQHISGRTGRIDIQLPSSAAGTVIVRLSHVDNKKNFAQKVLVR